MKQILNEEGDCNYNAFTEQKLSLVLRDIAAIFDLTQAFFEANSVNFLHVLNEKLKIFRQLTAISIQPRTAIAEKNDQTLFVL